MSDAFKKEVDKGLSSIPKTLPSKYFYDKKGDAFFVEIMDLPEYYLTRSELDIFENKTSELISALDIVPGTYFELIELGAGNGLKTKKLLNALVEQQFNFDYLPVDISPNTLKILEEGIKSEIPDVSIQSKQGDYFEVLASLKMSRHPKIILFLGSNIGNMDDETAAEFIYKLGANLHPGDKLLLGVDLIKSKEIVLPAYNDSKGVTAAFNLNLLERINRELGGNFDLNAFRHAPEYDEREGIAESFIESTADQTVTINALDKTYEFTEGEKIHTEISRKYNDELLKKLIADTDFEIKNKILDSKQYFADYILERT